MLIHVNSGENILLINADAAFRKNLWWVEEYKVLCVLNEIN